MNADPIKYGGGINLYQYVADNPLSHSDPTGKKNEGWPWWDLTFFPMPVELVYYGFKIWMGKENDYDLKTLPDGNTQVIINKNCTIVVLVGHGLAKKPHNFCFRAPCTAGAFVGCDAGSTNLPIWDIPPGGPGFPDHGIPGMKTNTGDIFPGGPPTSPDSERYWINMTMAGARKKAQGFCNNRKCCCEKVTIYMVGPPSEGAKRIGSETETVVCTK